RSSAARTTATGATTSCAAAATRSRPGRVRSCATSSPSACSAYRGRASDCGRLMQFAFTEDQELLRREARDVLANGGWGRDELAELGFLDRAVLFEEAGRANRGEEFFDAAAPEHERLAALALEAAGIAQRALELGVEHAKEREQFGRPI